MPNDNTVIVCINGRGGGSSSGMNELRDLLRQHLAPLGVNQDNIFRRSWNHGGDDDPFGAPDTSDLNDQIRNRTRQPSYLALIGFSYGGWAACRLSRVTDRVPNFVALIDPVFGATNKFHSGDTPRGEFISNWWQNNSITEGDVCTGLRLTPCFPATNGTSCGLSVVPGANQNIQEEFVKDWAGKRKKVRCVFQSVPKPTWHTMMDENQWIWRQIYDRIVSDLS